MRGRRNKGWLGGEVSPGVHLVVVMEAVGLKKEVTHAAASKTTKACREGLKYQKRLGLEYLKKLELPENEGD